MRSMGFVVENLEEEVGVEAGYRKLARNGTVGVVVEGHVASGGTTSGFSSHMSGPPSVSD